MRSKLWRILSAVAVAAAVASASVAPAAGESTNRALERIVKKGMFSAEDAARIQRAFASARQAKVEEREALTLVEACVDGEFDAPQVLRLLSVATQLALEGLPVDGFIAKVEEGASKRVSADRVVQVAERRAFMLNSARLMINSLVLQGLTVEDRDELLPDLAEALEAGRKPDEARAILTEALQSGERAGSIRRKLFP